MQYAYIIIIAYYVINIHKSNTSRYSKDIAVRNISINVIF